MKDRRITALEKQLSAIDRSAPPQQRPPPVAPVGVPIPAHSAPPPLPGPLEPPGQPCRSAGPPVTLSSMRGSVTISPQVRPASALLGLGAPGAPVTPGGMRPGSPIMPVGYGAPASMRLGPSGVVMPTSTIASIGAAGAGASAGAGAGAGASGTHPRGTPTAWKCKHCTFENRNPPIFDPQTREQVGFCEVCQNPTPLNF